MQGNTYPICTLCDKQFVTIDELNEHLLVAHGRNKSKVNDLNVRAAEDSGKIEALTIENRQLARELDELSRASGIAGIRDENAALKGDLEAVRNENAELKSNFEAAVLENDELKAKVGDIGGANKELMERVASLEEANSSIAAKLTEAEQAIAKNDE